MRNPVDQTDDEAWYAILEYTKLVEVLRKQLLVPTVCCLKIALLVVDTIPKLPGSTAI